MQLDTSRPRRIAIVTDAYYPQVNGVVTRISATERELRKRGHEVRIIAPCHLRRCLPLPGYSEIRLALFPYNQVARLLDSFQPDAIHIAVAEAPLGAAARRYCRTHGFAFTTSYHTNFPEYIAVRTKLPIRFIYPIVRRMHASAAHVLTTSKSMQQLLTQRGFQCVALWPRGVDTELFSPDAAHELSVERPVYLYAGRVAHEKNLDAFLEAPLDGTKYVVGDGPLRDHLERQYPHVMFTGYRYGRDLAGYIAAADVFVFPSTTDTNGLVMLEANACGTPVAAFPLPVTNEFIHEGVNGATDTDLATAAQRAYRTDRARVRTVAESYGWQYPTEVFLDHLVEV
jgi:glycosyltransferase involved in cell wall biosynthesis